MAEARRAGRRGGIAWIVTWVPSAIILLLLAVTAKAADERCIACDGSAGPDPIHATWHGRTVAVCSAGCEAAWEKNREELFQKVEARGALFDETSQQSDRSLVSGWMWFGFYVLAGLVCGAIAAYSALSKGLPGVPWLLAGLAFNVVAVALVALKPAGDLSKLPEGVPPGLAKIPSTAAPTPCPACGSESHPSARRCVRCGAELRSTGESESARALRGGRE